jgi:plasmid maintenance system antidote protein VapI
MKSGAEQLKDWLFRRRFLQREAADHLGFDETFVSQLVNGHRVPGLENAITIERLTGISVEAWLPSHRDSLAAATADSVRKSKSDKA